MCRTSPSPRAGSVHRLLPSRTAELKLQELIIKSGKEREEGPEDHTGFWHLWDRGEGDIADSARKEEGQAREQRLGVRCWWLPQVVQKELQER